jgi:hypothetical protein
MCAATLRSTRGSTFAICFIMVRTGALRGYAGRKIAKRLVRSIPWVGAVIALATLGSAIRKKGVLRGTLHSGLDAIPYVGGAKNLAELARGRDFLPDRVPR